MTYGYANLLCVQVFQSAALFDSLTVGGPVVVIRQILNLIVLRFTLSPQPLRVKSKLLPRMIWFDSLACLDFPRVPNTPLQSAQVGQNVGFVLYEQSKLSEKRIKEKVAESLNRVGLKVCWQCPPRCSSPLSPNMCSLEEYPVLAGGWAAVQAPRWAAGEVNSSAGEVNSSAGEVNTQIPGGRVGCSASTALGSWGLGPCGHDVTLP
eukprot:1187817-Prorocentrum_minimum.AAC.4